MNENRQEQNAELRLWQLISPALPIGSYAYSGGLEYAVEAKWVSDEETASKWIIGLVTHNLACLEVPVFLRIFKAWQTEDFEAIAYWNGFLLAFRESSELLMEDKNLGAALVKVLLSLGETFPKQELEDSGVIDDISYTAVFACACAKWGISPERGAEGLLWTWAENQVSAALKIIPLGQSAGQRILFQASDEIVAAVRSGFSLQDEEIGFLAQGMAIASARHETQYSRLFRS